MIKQKPCQLETSVLNKIYSILNKILSICHEKQTGKEAVRRGFFGGWGLQFQVEWLEEVLGKKERLEGYQRWSHTDTWRKNILANETNCSCGGEELQGGQWGWGTERKGERR